MSISGKTQSLNDAIWIGLIGIHPLSEKSLLGSNKGAYTNLLLFAKDIADYKSKAIEFMLENELEIYEFEDIEAFSERIKNNEVEEKLLYLAELVKQNGKPQIGTLHVFNEST
jgi:hypothetical protein